MVNPSEGRAEWELTGSERAQFISTTVEGYVTDRAGLCQAQAKKVVEWLEAKRYSKWKNDLLIDSHTWQELKRQVGL